MPKVMHLLTVCLMAAAAAATAGQAPANAGQSVPADWVFVNIKIDKRELYVGESVPVVIEAGARDDVVAALDSPPTLHGDAFTLNMLSGEPERAQRVIDGKPCTLLTWHSVLAAVKPGDLSLTIEAPFTVHVPLPEQAEASYADEATGDPYSDPAFQSLLQNTTAQAIVATSRPMSFHILALPILNRPSRFSGAVGHFTISSELSNRRSVVGEPLTLRMHVQGAGNFDRVNSDMLDNTAEWRIYKPTAAFTAAESTGFRGDKVFEQAVVATQSGTRNLPALEFSYFDPQTRRYEVARAPPLSIEVAAGPAAVAALAAPTATDTAHALATLRVAALARGDHTSPATTAESLVPPYLQLKFASYPLLLIVALAGVWFKARPPKPLLPPTSTAELLQQMEHAARRGDSELFFRSASRALRESRGVEHDTEVRELLRLADQVNYAGELPPDTDLQHCRRVVLRCLAAQPTS